MSFEVSGTAQVYTVADPAVPVFVAHFTDYDEDEDTITFDLDDDRTTVTFVKRNVIRFVIMEDKPQ